MLDCFSCDFNYNYFVNLAHVSELVHVFVPCSLYCITCNTLNHFVLTLSRTKKEMQRREEAKREELTHIQKEWCVCVHGQNMCTCMYTMYMYKHA